MRGKHAATLASRPPRVVWTEGERVRLIARAVETQAAHPDLAGLPLLRASMAVLPVSRRRKLVAVTQAPFFEAGVAAEIRRRTSEAKAEDGLAPILKGQAVTHSAVARTQDRIMDLHAKWHSDQHVWRGEVAQSQQGIIAMLSLMLRELVALNVKLGRPVPFSQPCECSAADERHKGVVKAARN